MGDQVATVWHCVGCWGSAAVGGRHVCDSRCLVGFAGDQESARSGLCMRHLISADEISEAACAIGGFDWLLVVGLCLVELSRLCATWLCCLVINFWVEQAH